MHPQSNIMRVFFFFNDTATTEIYTLSLHDALPISQAAMPAATSGIHQRALTMSSATGHVLHGNGIGGEQHDHPQQKSAEQHVDRKSTRLNSSHGYISYAVFCLKKKKAGPDPTSKLC